MRARVLVLISAAGLAAACGSSSSGAAAPPPAPPPPAQEPDVNPTTAEPSPPPSPPSPSPGPSPSPRDRFVDLERLDPDAECDALVPARIPDPVSVKVEPLGAAPCGAGTSEGTGHVAVQAGITRWQVFAPDGKREQELAPGGALWPQPSGWQAVTLTGRNLSGAQIDTFFADGSPRRSETPQPPFRAGLATTAPDPHGGSIVAVIPGSSSPCDGQGLLYRYDAVGAQAGPPAQIDCGGPFIGVSNAGEALVVQSPAAGSLRLRWVRPDGTLATQGSSSEPFRGTAFDLLVPLLDGSLVTRAGLSAQQRWAHLAIPSDAPPAWLRAHDGQNFRFTRGNKGYAFFPGPGQSATDCTQVVELLAPSGRRCAKLTFRRDGNACRTGAIDQGWDGTVVQQDSAGACGWRFWPRLLAGE